MPCRCCVCNHIDPEITEQLRIHNEIQKLLAKDKKEFKREIKILLLGTGEAGKSTFIKQIKIIHGEGYSTDEARLMFKGIIYQNILTDIKVLIEATSALSIMFENPLSEDKASVICSLNRMDDHFDQVISEMISDLWIDAGIQEAYNERRKYQLPDNAKYYLSNLQRITAHGYIPNIQDILQSRVATSGIQEFDFLMGKENFRIVDVGGQRGEREKWLKCFDNVHAVIFIVALSEYDQVLAEDNQVNRMYESLKLFHLVTTKVTYFEHSSIILFLNKKDLFEEKIMISDLVDSFPNYTGPKRNPLAARDYILKMFSNSRRRSSGDQRLYSHFTCATDTENIKFVFASVKDTILNWTLKRVNLD